MANKAIAPYSAICLVQGHFNAQAGVRSGTGFLYRSDLVVTAAHVILDRLGGATATPDRIEIYIGQGFDPPHPANLVRIAAAGAFDVHPTYRASGSPQFDVGVIRIAPVATPPLAVMDLPADIAGRPLRVAGYPSDKTPFGEWEHVGPFHAQDAANFLHFVDTSEGQSGAPVLLEHGEVVGLHLRAGKFVSPPLRQTNEALRLRPEIITWLNSH